MISDKFETEKAPLEVLNYVIDWTEELELSTPTDQILTSVWTLEDSHVDDLTLGVEGIEGTDHTIQKVSGGGRIGITHRLVNRITTVGALTHQRTIRVLMTRR
jgi:hypothetical protein